MAWVFLLANLDPARVVFFAAGQPDLPPWANYGILGVIIIALVVTKSLVPGWIYTQTASENKALKDDVKLLTEKLLTLSESAVPALRESTQTIIQAIEELRLIRGKRR